MRLLLLAAIVALGAFLWLVPGRRAVRRGLAPAAEASSPSELELLEPSIPTDARSSSSAGDALASRRKRATGTPTSGAFAPIHGRVIVAETGEPIEASFSVRLRTIDLLRSEDLHTRPDGSFRGTLPFPRSVVLALVKDEQGRELVDHEAAFDPACEDEWLVRVPSSAWPTFACGQVVDRHGAPLDQARVSLVPLAAGFPFAETESDEDGGFQLEDLRAGAYRLLLQGRWARAEPAEVRLRAGPNQLGALVVDEPGAAGDLTITLVSEDETQPTVLFELRDAGRTVSQRFDTSVGGQDEAGRVQIVIPGIPSGRYTLEVRSLDGLVYEPASFAFSPPAELELRTTGTARTGHSFRARDARTGEALLGFSVFGRFERTWRLHTAVRRVSVGGHFIRGERVDEVHLRPGFESWVVSAGGYRAASGTFAAAGGTIVVDLEPGWSELYQFEDADGDSFSLPGFERFLVPPVLSPVEVLVDERFVGESDADGLFALSAAGEPESISFRKTGWIPVSEYTLDILRTVVFARSP